MTDPSVQWLHRWPPTGPVTFRLGRAGDDLVAEWPSFGTLRADALGTRSELALEGGDAPPHVRERLGETIAALLRHLQGGVTLHASSVTRAGASVACLGESGAGKSTLAAKLCAGADVALLSDDTTALRLDVDRVEVDPTEGHHWLRPDMALAMGIDPSGYMKVPLAAARHGQERVALGAIVSLVFDDAASEPVLRRLHGVRAFTALSLSTFRFALDIPDVLQREFDNLARIAREVPLYELCRRREPLAMEASYPIVRHLLEGLSKSTETA